LHNLVLAARTSASERRIITLTGGRALKQLALKHIAEVSKAGTVVSEKVVSVAAVHVALELIGLAEAAPTEGALGKPVP
jgi:hypothetical protein